MRCMKKINDEKAVETFSVIKLISSEAFVEDEHPRDGDGKFASKDGGDISNSKPNSKSETAQKWQNKDISQKQKDRIDNHFKRNEEAIEKSDYKDTLRKLSDNYPDMMEKISKRRSSTCTYDPKTQSFDDDRAGTEMLCGPSSTTIFLEGRIFDKGDVYVGYVKGDAYDNHRRKDEYENMGGKNYIGHVFIEMNDGTIVDGAYGQVYPKEVNINADMRLRIISPDDPDHDDYVKESRNYPFLNKSIELTKENDFGKNLPKSTIMNANMLGEAFVEDQHPRDDDGKFTDKDGGITGKKDTDISRSLSTRMGRGSMDMGSHRIIEQYNKDNPDSQVEVPQIVNDLWQPMTEYDSMDAVDDFNEKHKEWKSWLDDNPQVKKVFDDMQVEVDEYNKILDDKFKNAKSFFRGSGLDEFSMVSLEGVMEESDKYSFQSLSMRDPSEVGFDSGVVIEYDADFIKDLGGVKTEYTTDIVPIMDFDTEDFMDKGEDIERADSKVNSLFADEQEVRIENADSQMEGFDEGSIKSVTFNFGKLSLDKFLDRYIGNANVDVQRSTPKQLINSQKDWIGSQDSWVEQHWDEVVGIMKQVSEKFESTWMKDVEFKFKFKDDGLFAKQIIESFVEDQHPRDSDGKFTSKGNDTNNVDKVKEYKDDYTIKQVLKSGGIPNEMELEKARLKRIIDEERKIDSDREFEYNSSDGDVYKMNGTQEYENALKDLNDHNKITKTIQKDYDEEYRKSYGWKDGDPLKWTEYNDDGGDSSEDGYGANYTYKHLDKKDKDVLMRDIWNTKTRDEREDQYNYLIGDNNFGEKSKTDKLWDDLNDNEQNNIIYEAKTYDGILYDKWLQGETESYYNWRKEHDGVLSDQEKEHNKLYSEYNSLEKSETTLTDNDRLEFAKTLWNDTYLEKHTDEELINQISSGYEKMALEEKQKKLWQEKIPKTYFGKDFNDRSEYAGKYYDSLMPHIKEDLLINALSPTNDIDDISDDISDDGDITDHKWDELNYNQQKEVQELMELSPDDDNPVSADDHSEKLEKYTLNMNPQKAIGFDYEKGIPSTPNIDDLKKWSNSMEKEAYSDQSEMNSKNVEIPIYPKSEQRSVEEHNKQVEKLTKQVGDMEPMNKLVKKTFDYISDNIDNLEFDMKMFKHNWEMKQQRHIEPIEQMIEQNGDPDGKLQKMIDARIPTEEKKWRELYVLQARTGNIGMDDFPSAKDRSEQAMHMANIVENNPEVEKLWNKTMIEMDKLNQDNYDLFLKTPEFYRGTTTEELDNYLETGNMGGDDNKYSYVSATMDRTQAVGNSNQRATNEGKERVTIIYDGDSTREKSVPLQYNSMPIEFHYNYGDPIEKADTPSAYTFYNEREIRMNEDVTHPKIVGLNFGGLHNLNPKEAKKRLDELVEKYGSLTKNITYDQWASDRI
jgi:hypothetical protein